MQAGVFGSRVWLEEEGLEDIREEFSRTLGRHVAGLAIWTGTTGAYRKLVLRIMAPDGRVLAYAKVATHRLAEITLESEHNILSAVSAAGDLRGSVPEVIGWFRWQDTLVLLLSPGPDVPGPSRFGTCHIRSRGCM